MSQKPGCVGEGDVQQGLVTVALGHLGVAARGPDRLADPARRLPGLASTNSRQAGMIRAGFAPTSSMSANWMRSASRPSACSSAAILALGEHDERRLVRGDAVAQELQDAVDEPVLAGVHQRLVSEGRGGQGGSSQVTPGVPRVRDSYAAEWLVLGSGGSGPGSGARDGSPGRTPSAARAARWPARASRCPRR